MSKSVHPAVGMVVRRVARRAFTLVELLVVIAIIALLISILLPALNGARNAGMKSSTQNMITAFTNASSAFANDHGSAMPGYYSAFEMGSSENWGSSDQSGMSAMENVMIDLGGTDVILGRHGDDNAPTIDQSGGVIGISPYAEANDDRGLIININLIGASGAYFAPDKKFFRTADPEFNQTGTRIDNGQHLMPDLVDAFGNPVLVWVKDEAARGSIDPDADTGDDVYRQFATLNSDGNTDDEGPAWFYLASNETFFGNDITNVGESAINQMSLSSLSAFDPIGGDVDPIERIRTLSTLMASPSYYLLKSGESLGGLNGTDGVGFADIYPAKPRGRLIVQSAGVDGAYFGTDDGGWKNNAMTSGSNFNLNFGSNYKLESGKRMVDEDGKAITGDIASEFDDITSTIN